MARSDGFVRRVVAFALASTFTVAFAQLTNWGNRDEGTVDRLNAKLDYELLGFYAYRQAYALSDDVNLRLRFYLPESESFFIKAREIKVDKHYEMVPHPDKVTKDPEGWREFTGWPVSAVLKPKKISADNLGVIVRLGGSGEAVQDIRPALLFASQLPQAIDEYVLYVTVRRKLKTLDYDISGASGYSKTYQQKKDQKDRSIEGDTVIPIRFSASQLPPGSVLVRIHGPYANDLTAEPLDITYRFYHKPL
jgi:hypothetical protein